MKTGWAIHRCVSTSSACNGSEMRSRESALQRTAPPDSVTCSVARHNIATTRPSIAPVLPSPSDLTGWFCGRLTPGTVVYPQRFAMPAPGSCLAERPTRTCTSAARHGTAMSTPRAMRRGGRCGTQGDGRHTRDALVRILKRDTTGIRPPPGIDKIKGFEVRGATQKAIDLRPWLPCERAHRNCYDQVQRESAVMFAVSSRAHAAR
jgi:hypothetical protein